MQGAGLLAKASRFTIGALESGFYRLTETV
jgi:hypothetical protein